MATASSSGRGPTCLDCTCCEELPFDAQEAVRRAVGHGMGFCTEYEEWVTDEESVEETGSADVCFKDW